MLAPQCSNNRVVFCFSASVMRRRGKRQQSRGSAGNQTDDQIVRAGLARNLRDAPRAGHAAPVGYRMAALVDLDAPKLRAVTVFDVDLAGGDARAKQSFHRASHLRAGFARADHKDVPELAQVIALATGDQHARWMMT